MNTSIRFLTLALAALLLAPMAATAQDSPPLYVWVNFLKAQPGQGDALMGTLIEQGTETWDPLVENGSAVNWGIAMNVFHDGGDEAVYVEWVSFLGWEAMDQFMQAFMAKRQAMSPEELAAEGERMRTLTVAGSHADMVNRSAAIEVASPNRPSYIHLGYYQAAPGQSEAAMALWNELAVPALDKAAAGGAVLAYGLHVPAVHRNQDWTHMSWYTSETLAARDAVDAAFAENADELNARMAEAFTENHSDQILMVMHYKEASSDG